MAQKRKRKPGRKIARLKIEGDWEEAAKKLVRRKKPEEGWPDEEGKPKLK